jgi:hypothetical protein
MASGVKSRPRRRGIRGFDSRLVETRSAGLIRGPASTRTLWDLCTLRATDTSSGLRELSILHESRNIVVYYAYIVLYMCGSI